MPRTRSVVLSGLTFLAFGAAFAAGALGYPLGTTARMGPGFFPLLLGVVLVVLGVLLLLRPTEADDAPLTAPRWRGLFLLLGGLVVFGLTIRGLGLVPSVFLTSLLAAFASPETRPPAALLLAVALTAICVAVFVLALQLPLPLFGPWVPGR